MHLHGVLKCIAISLFVPVLLDDIYPCFRVKGFRVKGFIGLRVLGFRVLGFRVSECAFVYARCSRTCLKKNVSLLPILLLHLHENPNAYAEHRSVKIPAPLVLILCRT